eukprot:TRINITY_DN55829_c0_g1_i1.p1 TRINITY_DN55829_c0_g1~~TRINITY_DN55829_c0_g1_i1.p1  ORF type:complete len:444 (+),score=89.27 TRINITY_DN55829_c0_g1_i1:111-1442(+)
MAFAAMHVSTLLSLFSYIRLISAMQKPAPPLVPSQMMNGSSNESDPSIFTVTLSKHTVPIVIGGREVSKKTAYAGDIYMGQPFPQKFSVVFDSGSGHLFVPSGFCYANACANHNQYVAKRSSTGVPQMHDGSNGTGNPDEDDQVSISYGTGDVIGNFVDEVVCVSHPAPMKEDGEPLPLGEFDTRHCARAHVIVATELSEEPFNYVDFDGVLGLGLESLALNPEFHVFGQLAKSGMIKPIFSFFLSVNDEVASEITFGGIDAARVRGDMLWLPVVQPDRGFWSVAIKAVKVGNASLSICDDGTCVAIVDTGTSIMGVPSVGANELSGLTSLEIQAENAAEVDCRSIERPPIVFEFEDGNSLELESSRYSRWYPSPVNDNVTNMTIGHVCRGNLLSFSLDTLGDKAFIWGEPMLQKYYSAYDWGEQRVGLALAVQPEKPELILE